MPRILDGVAMAAWRSMSALQMEGRVETGGARPIRLQHLPLPILGNEQHNFSRHSSADLEMVSGDLFDDRIQERYFRLPSSAHA